MTYAKFLEKKPAHLDSVVKFIDDFKNERDNRLGEFSIMNRDSIYLYIFSNEGEKIDPIERASDVYTEFSEEVVANVLEKQYMIDQKYKPYLCMRVYYKLCNHYIFLCERTVKFHK